MKKSYFIAYLLCFGTLAYCLNTGVADSANLHPLEEPQSFGQEQQETPQAPQGFIAPERTNRSEKIDFEEAYRNLIPCDVTFENGLDPYEQQDNYSYGRSPYPLLRTVMEMTCQSIKVEPGYYLLTPRKINGRTYMLFKQLGKVCYYIPVFGERQIDPEAQYPQAKDPYDSAPFGLRSIWKLFGIIAGRRTPIVKTPQYKMDCFAYDDQFYGINVYFKDRIYKMVFKIKNYE